MKKSVLFVFVVLAGLAVNLAAQAQHKPQRSQKSLQKKEVKQEGPKEQKQEKQKSPQGQSAQNAQNVQRDSTRQNRGSRRGGEQGQRSRDPEEMADRAVKRLDEELKLTEEQKKELKIWYTETNKKQGEEFEKQRDDREAMRESMQKLRTETRAKMEKVLTKEQYEKYVESEKKREADRGRGRNVGM
ncbi:hypothetical protein FACS1894199_09730 [Bacteroidia bacterium]|nr:hypothetical protein FACS1894199_09730 [Bacteroidia bacterium]